MTEEWSRKKGQSKYPVTPGTVVKLQVPCLRRNPKLGIKIPHTVFIWVMRVCGDQPKHRPPKLQKIHILEFYWPVAEEYRDHFLMFEKDVQQETIVKQMLCSGYELLSQTCNYWYDEASEKRFYNTIGYFTSASP